MDKNNHNITHFTNVAIMGYLINKRINKEYNEEMIVAGMFHDVGRVFEDFNQMPHGKCS